MSSKNTAEHITKFVAELEAMVRDAAVDAVKRALAVGGGTVAAAAPAKAAAKAAAPAAKAAPKGRKGGKRDPKVIAAMTDKVRAFVKANPGKGVEEIGKGMGVATAELKLPIQKLLAAKALTTKGQKRATKYFPA